MDEALEDLRSKNVGVEVIRMQEILNRYLPNVMGPAGVQQGDQRYAGHGGLVGSIAFVLGLVLGVVLIVTRPGGILENKVLYRCWTR